MGHLLLRSFAMALRPYKTGKRVEIANGAATDKRHAVFPLPRIGDKLSPSGSRCRQAAACCHHTVSNGGFRPFRLAPAHTISGHHGTFTTGRRFLGSPAEIPRGFPRNTDSRRVAPATRSARRHVGAEGGPREPAPRFCAARNLHSLSSAAARQIRGR